MKKLLFLIGFCFCFPFSNAYSQCTLVCNNSNQIYLEAHCIDTLTPQQLLQGDPIAMCPSGNLITEVKFGNSWGPGIINSFQIGQTVQVRVRDLISGQTCWGMASVQDTTPPLCIAPPNVTVDCETFDPTLWNYGQAQVSDNCCLDYSLNYLADSGYIHTADFSLFDTVCNYGSIVRTFKSADCVGNSTTCTQIVTVIHNQDYYFGFPNDQTVYSCDSASNYGAPIIYDVDCELMNISYVDTIITLIPDACYKIERTWTIKNECTYNSNLVCENVFNPSNTSTGPHLSPFPPNSGHPHEATNSAYYNQYINQLNADGNVTANCWIYRQEIKVIDNDPPTGVMNNTACDMTPNDANFYNDLALYDATTGSHDLCEGPADLCITATDLCSGPNTNVRYLLFLDTDADGTMETVINSLNPPATATINIGNAFNQNYAGGTPVTFDKRPLPVSRKYRFGTSININGNEVTACLAWKEHRFFLTDPTHGVTPELPHGTHKIKWFIEDACGNVLTNEKTFTISDCKNPTVVCKSVPPITVLNTSTSNLNVNEVLDNGNDNCTPANLIQYGLCLNEPIATANDSCTGTFPLNSNGTHDTLITFDCSQTGIQTVRLWAKDLAGNMDFCETSVNVQGGSLLVLNCPSDTTLINPCVQFFEFNTPPSGSYCGLSNAVITVAADSILLSHTSATSFGGTFTEGIHTVTIYMTDTASSYFDSCSFTVTIPADTVPPVLHCPADVSLQNTPLSCNNLVFLNRPTALDNCPTSFLSYSTTAVGINLLPFGAAVGGLFPIGTNTVTYTATDDAGNTGTCSFTVTVTDTEPPNLLNCPPNQDLCIAHTSTDTIVTWTPPTGSDNCPSFIVTSSHNSGMAFPIGTTNVNYLVMDASANTADCSFEIIVSNQPIWYVDTDGDGFGDANTNQYACTQPVGYVNNMLDCNDTDSLINPNAIEICNGLDDNCDGQIDEGVTTDYWPDLDMDGFGDATTNSIASCSAPTNYVTNNNDCDDSNPSIFPSQTEICNGIDDDCDGLIDENLACRRPSWINATNIGSDSVLLNWGMSCGVTAYRVRYKPLSNVTHRYKVLSNIPINSLNIYDLCYNTVYQVGVSALCNGTWTSWRNTTFTTASTATCTNPYFTGINVTHDNITLFWVDIQGESHQRLQWREQLNKNNKGFVNVPTNLNSYTITGLKANTDYEYRIRVRCNGNWLRVPPYNRARTGLAPLPNLSTQRATNSSNNLFLKISPNPSAGRINATTNLSGTKNYIILSPQGSLMTQWQDERQSLELDLSDLPGGAYFLVVKNEFGERIQEKVVVVK